MSHNPSIDNDDFKHGEIDFEAIRIYLTLTDGKSFEIASLAAAISPKGSGKFDADALVKKAILINAAAHTNLELERGHLISKMNLITLLRLHSSIHGNGDRDYLAQQNPKRLSDLLAGPLALRMYDVAEVRDLIRKEKQAIVDMWQNKFAKAAKGKSTLSMTDALKIVFPRAENRTTYYNEYCKITGKLTDPISRLRPITSTDFPEFATEIRAAYEANKDTWTKKAQRAGGKKGGKKAAANKKAAADQEAARSLESMQGALNERGIKGRGLEHG